MRILDLIAQTLYDKKGLNILALDVRGVSTLTEYFLIAEGNVDRHVIALGKAIIERLKKEGMIPLHVEGLSSGDWLVLDYLDIVVHLFMPGVRQKYQLEALWHEAEIVPLQINLEEKSPLVQG